MESELLIGRINDTAEICLRTDKFKFLGFLSQEQSVLANSILKNRNVNYKLYGGYENAQRVMLGCFPDWAEDFVFPITAVTFSYRPEYKLTHRDFLGSLMALGITRESVGDILVEDGRAVVFLTNEVKEFVLNQITKIGRVGVDIEEGFVEPLPISQKLAEFSDTIASVRLDCVVSALADVSRNKACELIENGFVSVNSVVCEKITKEIHGDDILTVRGKGKFIICSLGARTKKQRIILVYKKYI